MIQRWIILQRMEQEGVIVSLKKVQLNVSVLPRLHVDKCTLGSSHLCDEGLAGFAHHEHWEVVVVFFVLINDILSNGRECLLIPLIGDCFLTISWNVDAVYSIQ